MLDFLRLCAERSIIHVESGHHHTTQGWITTHCPFCSNGREGFHLGFSTKSGAFNCWRCGKLNFWDTLERLLHIHDRQQLKKILAPYFSGSQRENVTKEVRRGKEADKPIGIVGLQPQHQRYLQNRGFDPDQLVKEWEISGTNHLGGKWAWRVVYPIKNQQGKIVAYQGRAISDSNGAKYKTTEDGKCVEPPDTFLYGIEKVVGKSVIVVEGVTGVWRFGPGTVATLGIDWHDAQLNILRRFENVAVLYDPEPKAQQRALQLGNALSLFGVNTEVLSGFTKDPGEIGVHRARDIRKKLGFPI